jgi:hypothetical protein
VPGIQLHLNLIPSSSTLLSFVFFVFSFFFYSSISASTPSPPPCRPTSPTQPSPMRATSSRTHRTRRHGERDGFDQLPTPLPTHSPASPQVVLDVGLPIPRPCRSDPANQLTPQAAATLLHPVFALTHHPPLLRPRSRRRFPPNERRGVRRRGPVRIRRGRGEGSGAATRLGRCGVSGRTSGCDSTGPRLERCGESWMAIRDSARFVQESR